MAGEQSAGRLSMGDWWAFISGAFTGAAIVGVVGLWIEFLRGVVHRHRWIEYDREPVFIIVAKIAPASGSKNAGGNLTTHAAQEGK